jgi:nicotinate phosphoribosyltransferase
VMATAGGGGPPEHVSSQVCALHTDLYQVTMALAYFLDGRHETDACFELFFRRHPFGGEFTLLAGVSEAVRFIETFRFTAGDLAYLRAEPALRHAPAAFFAWLGALDTSRVTVHAMREGSVAMPRCPLLRIAGPIATVQLLETQLLNLVNYASLVCTNAARFTLAAGPGKELLEFGLRRAQGPDGALSASRYSYLGGFSASSNVLAGRLFGIPIRGTHAHSFVTSYGDVGEVANVTVPVGPHGSRLGAEGSPVNLRDRALHHIAAMGLEARTNAGELAAFISYAAAFPDGFLTLIDTYDTLHSGVPNFLAVALALRDAGRRAVGVRLDSGDLAYLSREVRRRFREVAAREREPWISDLTIVASNDIDVPTLLSLASQGHAIDAYGIGTHLVTCREQPALGGVFKLVEAGGTARIKLSQDMDKMTLPGRKAAYRLYIASGEPVLDLLTPDDEAPPRPGESVLCRHPFDEAKQVIVVASRVEPLLACVFASGRAVPGVHAPLAEMRAFAMSQLALFREDHLRFLNPTPYKTSVSPKMYAKIRDVWRREAQIAEIR